MPLSTIIRPFYLDFETRSECSLKDCGSWAYSKHPSTEILCMAYAFEDSPVKVVAYDSKEHYKKFFLKLKEASKDKGYTLVLEAHNASFEQAIIQNVIGVPYKTFYWKCSAALAAYYSLPRSLGECGKALGLSVIKDEEGRRVMLQLCKPRSPSVSNPDKFHSKEKFPDKFKTLYKYCIGDVEAEREITKKLLGYGGLSNYETLIWELDNRINNRGVPIDIDSVYKCIEISDLWKKSLDAKVLDITDGDLSSSNKIAALKNWINKKYNLSVEKLNKETLPSLLEEDLPQTVLDLLQIRHENSKTSVAKYSAMVNSIDLEDFRIKGAFSYCGASTGRWSGNIVQFQNLPSGVFNKKHLMEEAIKDLWNFSLDEIREKYGEPLDFLSSLMRGVVKAPKGYELVVSDFTSVEVRILAWLSGCTPILEAFEKGTDLYIQMGAKIFGKNENEISKDSFERKIGKQAVLGCGYGMGATTFKHTCASYGIEIDDNLAKQAVKTYRKSYPEVTKYWEFVERACIAVVSGQKDPSYRFVKDREFLFITLPSGRRLSFFQPEVVKDTTSWGQYKPTLSFMTVFSKTKKWTRRTSYGGKMTENICQAVARDFMANALLNLERSGKYKPVLHVHDEAVSLCKEGEGDIEEYNGLMTNLPKWGERCPIEAEGWIGERYFKG